MGRPKKGENSDTALRELEEQIRLAKFPSCYGRFRYPNLSSICLVYCEHLGYCLLKEKERKDSVKKRGSKRD